MKKKSIHTSQWYFNIHIPDAETTSEAWISDATAGAGDKPHLLTPTRSWAEDWSATISQTPVLQGAWEELLNNKKQHDATFWTHVVTALKL